MRTYLNTMTLGHGAIALAGLVLASGLLAAPPTKAPDPTSPEAVYRRDRADCLAGRSAQDRKTCLQEAGAALAAARRGQLVSPDAATLVANALRRCQAVRAEDRSDCERMARGEGSREGSVAEGAILKRISRIVVEAPAAGAPSAPASAASTPG